MFECSYHFIPADRPTFFEKIGEIPADAFVFDLEDAVAIDRKPEAIKFLNRWLAEHQVTRPVFVRVNGTAGPWVGQEAALLAAHPGLGLVLPKTGGVNEASSAIGKYLGGNERPILLLIEDTSALLHLRELTSLPGVRGIGIGLEDLLSGQPFARSDLATLVERIRTEVALHCAAAGLQAIDSISLDLTGGDELVAEAKAARAAGMNAMFSIHPRQLNAIHRVFSPSEKEIADARWIVAAAGTHGESGGYQTINGVLLSPPKIRKARAILESARPYES